MIQCCSYMGSRRFQPAPSDDGGRDAPSADGTCAVLLNG